MDWSNKQAVIAFADACGGRDVGAALTVIKRPERANHNIIHTAREAELLRDAVVVHRTGGN